MHSVCFSCDKRLLLSGSRDETVRLWNLDLRRNIVIYRMDAPVWDAQFCNRGLYFASATASKCVSLYSTERIHPIRIFTDAKDDVTCLDFHPNSNFVAGGSDDGNIYMWDMLTGNAVQVFSGHKSFVHSVKVIIKLISVCILPPRFHLMEELWFLLAMMGLCAFGIFYNKN